MKVDYPRSTIVSVDEIKCLLSGGCTVFLQLDPKLSHNRAIIVNMSLHFMSHNGFMRSLNSIMSRVEEENQYLIRMNHDNYQYLETSGLIDKEYVKII